MEDVCVFRAIEPIDLANDNSSMSAEESSHGTHSRNGALAKSKNSKPHLSNIRRKKNEREVLKILVEVSI